MDNRQTQLVAWLQQEIRNPFDIKLISGDASFRRYFRVIQPDHTLIAVDAPPDKENSQPFLQVAEAYAAQGLPVPRVLAHDLQQGFYCQSDMGDTLFADVLTADNYMHWYQQAMAHLPAIAACTRTQGGALPAYDDALLAREFYLFSHWLLVVHLRLELSASEQQQLADCFAWIANEFKAQPQVGVHRDYHSRNLMILPDQRVGIIDFQDAVTGPVTYDLVSLLRDCYQKWPADGIRQLVTDFQRQYYPEYATDFQRWFDITGLQRHIKASGIFARLYHRDGKAGYLESIQPTLKYITDVGAHYPQVAYLVWLVKQKVLPGMQECH